MSGGKGGSNTSSVQIPSWLEDAAKTNLSKADYAGQIGYTPYYGPDVAAQTQNQMIGNQATYDAAAALGLAPQGGNANAGMPTPTVYDNGITGYSSGGLYDQALAELAARRPGQAEALNSMFIDPYSGDTQTAFLPTGSVGTNDAASLNIAPFIPSLTSDSESENGVQLTPEQKYYSMMQFNDMTAGYPIYMPGGMLAKGIQGLNEYQMTNFENANLGWGAAPNVNHPVTVIDSRDSDSGSMGPQYSVSDVTSGGGFDPSGTSGGNYSGTGGGGGLVF